MSIYYNSLTEIHADAERGSLIHSFAEESITMWKKIQDCLPGNVRHFSYYTLFEMGGTGEYVMQLSERTDTYEIYLRTECERGRPGRLGKVKLVRIYINDGLNPPFDLDGSYNVDSIDWTALRIVLKDWEL